MDEVIKDSLIDFFLYNRNEAISLFEKDGRIVFSNYVFKDVFGDVDVIFSIFNSNDTTSVKREIENLKINETFKGEYILNELYGNRKLCIEVFRGEKYFIMRTEISSEHEKMVEELISLRFLFEQIPDVIVVFSKDGELMYINRAFFNYFDYDYETIRGHSFFKILKDYLSPDVFEEIMSFISTGSGELRKKVGISGAKNSTIFSLALFPIKCETEPKTFALIMEDIEIQEKLSKEITKLSKFDSLKVITDGISHDINNVLAALIGNISLAKCYVDQNSPVYGFLEESEKACSRARDLSFKLLSISKGAPLLKQQINLSKLITEVTEFIVNGKFHECGIEVLYEFERDDIVVEADEVQIVQVIDNIVTNACQAMPHGGRLVVGLKLIELVFEKNYLPIPEGKYCCMYFEDTGKGIPPNILSKIFDPYFTTKPEGSGLGLSISYSIIRNHKGYIDVISRIGVGTTFFVYLPL